jgi:hypothetical protein
LQEISFASFRDVGLHDIVTVWNNLTGTTQFYMAGLIGNPLILILILYWIYKSKINEKSTLLFISFFSLSIPPILFGETEIQTRFLYEIPFQIPAAIALTRIRMDYGKLLMIACCIWIIAISLRASMNLYFIE